MVCPEPVPASSQQPMGWNRQAFQGGLGVRRRQWARGQWAKNDAKVENPPMMFAFALDGKRGAAEAGSAVAEQLACKQPRPASELRQRWLLPRGVTGRCGT